MALTSGDLNRIKELILDALDDRIAPLDERFVTLDRRIATVDDRITVVDERLEELARMIQNNVIVHMATKDDIARLEVRLSSHDHRLDHIESHLADVAANQRKLVTILSAKHVLTSGEVSALSSP